MKYRRCLVCGRAIMGSKKVGDTRIRDKNGRVIGDAIKVGKELGYAHIEHCDQCPFYSRVVRTDRSVYFWCMKDTQILNGSEVRYRIPTTCPLPELHTPMTSETTELVKPSPKLRTAREIIDHMPVIDDPVISDALRDVGL